MYMCKYVGLCTYLNTYKHVYVHICIHVVYVCECVMYVAVWLKLSRKSVCEWRYAHQGVVPHTCTHKFTVTHPLTLWNTHRIRKRLHIHTRMHAQTVTHIRESCHTHAHINPQSRNRSLSWTHTIYERDYTFTHTCMHRQKDALALTHKILLSHIHAIPVEPKILGYRPA